MDKMNDLLAAYQADLYLRRMTDTTIVVNRSRLKIFLAWCEAHELDPCRASREDILAYLEHLQSTGPKSATLRKDFSVLAGFYELLEEQGKSGSAVHVRSIRKKYLRSYKSDAEERQIISVQQMAEMIASTVSTRDRAIIYLLAKTGIRRGELFTLDVSDVDMAGMSIHLKPTAKRSNRTVFFDRETQEALQLWLQIRANRKARDPALFIASTGKRLAKRSIHEVIVRAASRVGLHTPGAPLEKRFGPHCCRHWFTTHLRRAGMPREFIQELRGDVRREAIDIYDHIDKEELRKSYLAHIPQLGV
ncbi:MAG: tyrosine-type recombinase/integrase [Methanothrix sp.]